MYFGERFDKGVFKIDAIGGVAEKTTGITII